MTSGCAGWCTIVKTLRTMLRHVCVLMSLLLTIGGTEQCELPVARSGRGRWWIWTDSRPEYAVDWSSLLGLRMHVCREGELWLTLLQESGTHHYQHPWPSHLSQPARIEVYHGDWPRIIKTYLATEVGTVMTLALLILPLILTLPIMRAQDRTMMELQRKQHDIAEKRRITRAYAAALLNPQSLPTPRQMMQSEPASLMDRTLTEVSTETE